MRKTWIAIALSALLAQAWAQPETEAAVLEKVRRMMTESGGRVTFSTLVNNDEFNAEQKRFLSRLYEIFFRIPAVLKSEYQSTGAIPTRKQLGANFAISAPSVDLLLKVMRSDPRVPPLFTVGPSGEIESLNMDNINAFIEQRGDSVRVTSWQGQAMPDFRLQTLEGGSIARSDLRGHPSLVYFWFTGCPPCGRISPHLAALEEKYAGKGFRMVGVNADRILGISASDERRKQYLDKHGIDFVNAHLDEKTRQAFGGIQIYPTLFFADASGTIVRHFINYQGLKTLESAVREAMD